MSGQVIGRPSAHKTCATHLQVLFQNRWRLKTQIKPNNLCSPGKRPLKRRWWRWRQRRINNQNKTNTEQTEEVQPPHCNRFTALFPDHPGEPVPEENFWTLWCKGRLTEADTSIIRLGATSSGISSAHLHHPPIFLQAGCPSCRPTNSVKALKATSTFGLERRR